MKTVSQLLADDVAELKSRIQEFLCNHSRLRSNKIVSFDEVEYINLSGGYSWEALSLSGRREQNRLLTEFRKFEAVVAALIQEVAVSDKESFAEACRLITKNLDQSTPVWSPTPDQAANETLAAIDAIQELINGLCSSDHEVYVVPDTNALLANPRIETWAFEDCACFSIVFMPTILEELDELKVSHRNPDVREKAKSIIRQIREYLRRGDLSSGITIVTGRIRAYTIAVEPNMGASLPWLDRDNNDDRFLASVIELMRAHVRSSVVIVTGDINLLNKAQFARIPFWDPPMEAALLG